MTSRGSGWTRWAALLALFCAGAARAERLPIQADVDICAMRASEHGDTSIEGSVRLQLLLRADGKVYAAFIHSAKGVNDKVFEYCLASNALFWQYPAVGLDTSSPFPITVTPGGASSGHLQSSQTPPQVFLPSAHPEVEPAELDAPRAQASLNILAGASVAERGQAALAVHDYATAIARFRAALEKDAADPLALRGLAQALAETQGDLAEARALAMKLVTAAPESVAGNEAMLRVCAAAKDDPCVWEAWKRVRASVDMAPRSRIVQDELKPMVEKSAARLKAAAQERPGHAAGAPVDPCAAQATEDQQALCEVKRCLGAGSALYAQELSKDGAEFEVGEWSSKVAGRGRLLVTRPISSKPKEGAIAERRDAIFLVKLGQQFSIQPSNGDARKIAMEHNACVAPPAAAQSPTAAAPSAASSAAVPTPAPAAAQAPASGAASEPAANPPPPQK